MEELVAIERMVRRQRVLALGLGVAVVSTYVVRVFLTGDRIPSAESWGQFGDFVGGVLNPVIAYLAFYWLTQSVLIQRKELEETKQALEASAKAQQELSAYTLRTVQMGALGHLLNALGQELDTAQSTQAAVESGMATVGRAVIDGQVAMAHGDAYERFRFEMQNRVRRITAERQELLDYLRAIAQEHQG